MTNDDKITLSKQVAELYGLSRNHNLADDSARVFELAVKYELSIVPWTDCVDVRFYIDEVFSETWLKENYADHPTKAEATRIAILKCLVKMKEGM